MQFDFQVTEYSQRTDLKSETEYQLNQSYQNSNIKNEQQIILERISDETIEKEILTSMCIYSIP